jgi:uncharacterized protein
VVHSVVLKVAELCNLNCGYCYMYNHNDRSFLKRPKLLSTETLEHLLRRLDEHCTRHAPHRIAITLHGGEPLLLGPELLGRYAGRIAEALGDKLAWMALQTNATLVNKSFIDVFHRENIHIGVSLDGPAAIHDAERVDHRGRGSHVDAVRGLLQLQDAGLHPGVLCVVNPRMPGLEVYEHFRDLGVEWMSFLLPDITHDSKLERYGGLGKAPVARYLIPVFDRWWSDDDPDVRVRLFWDLIRSLLGATPESDAFGGALNYVVIETDGAIQPVDTLRACESGMIETGLNVRTHGLDDLHLGPPLLHQLVTQGLPLCATCRACPEVAVCRGGYVTHRYSRANGFDNPSAWCADLLALIQHIRRKVTRAHRTMSRQSYSLPTASATAF